MVHLGKARLKCQCPKGILMMFTNLRNWVAWKLVKLSDKQIKKIMQIGRNIRQPLFVLDPVLNETHQVESPEIILKISALLTEAKLFDFLMFACSRYRWPFLFFLPRSSNISTVCSKALKFCRKDKKETSFLCRRKCCFSLVELSPVKQNHWLL